MNEDPPHEVTQLLQRWKVGDQHALEELLQVVYDELRAVAANHLRRERVDHTLQTQDLVHEAYLKLSHGGPLELKDRAHFFRVAAQAMRRVLVDHARRQQAAKRIGPEQRVVLDVELPAAAGSKLDVLAVHEALGLLSKISPRQAELVELRYFGGLTQEEAAEVMGISLSTLAREWRVAKLWLYQRLAQG